MVKLQFGALDLALIPSMEILAFNLNLSLAYLTERFSQMDTSKITPTFMDLQKEPKIVKLKGKQDRLEQVLCILTSKRVLCTLLDGQIVFFHGTLIITGNIISLLAQSGVLFSTRVLHSTQCLQAALHPYVTKINNNKS